MELSFEKSNRLKASAVDALNALRMRPGLFVGFGDLVKRLDEAGEPFKSEALRQTISEVEEEFAGNLSGCESRGRLVSQYKAAWGAILDSIEKETARCEDELEAAFDGAFLNVEERKELWEKYDTIRFGLRSVKDSMESLFARWGEADQSQGASQYRIAARKRTEFIKVICMLYDLRFFETEKGFVASNKEKLLKDLGRFFGANLDNYSTLLVDAMDNKNPFKIFDDMKKKWQETIDNYRDSERKNT